jgi:hypothetical protein
VTIDECRHLLQYLSAFIVPAPALRAPRTESLDCRRDCLTVRPASDAVLGSQLASQRQQSKTCRRALVLAFAMIGAKLSARLDRL